MKTSFLTIVLMIFNVAFSSAQNSKLYGMTQFGGSTNQGIIFSYEASTSTYTKLKDFDGANGSYPNGNLIQASDGKFYGMTSGGGSFNYFGVIFSFDPSTGSYTKLHDFDYTNGANPNGSLIQASNGLMYGMTYYGGSNGSGVIFSFDPSTGSYAKLHDFDYTNGANPNGSLIQASDGKLYGMTLYGGSANGGVIFSFDPSGATYIKIRDFDISTGTNPFGSLIQAADEKLYGMTNYAGANIRGVIFSFDPSNATYTKLKDFDGVNGALPYGSLVQASDGKLYGMTANGGSIDYGVIFSFDPSNAAYLKLWDFDYTNGGNPYGTLMQAADGKLYGMTYYGGSNNLGVAFSFDVSTGTLTNIQDFTGANGANPSGSSFTEVTCAPPKPTITASGSVNNVCPGKTITLTSSLATSYLWNTGDTTRSIIVSAAGPYTVTIANENGCQSTSDATVVTYDICAVPSGLAVSSITSSSAKIKWNAVTCAVGYQYQYKKKGTTTWTTTQLTATGKILTGLSPNTTYQWRVLTGCQKKPTIIASAYTNGPEFKTVSAGAFVINNSDSTKNIAQRSILVSPNPATNIITVQVKGYIGNATIQLIDLQGKLLKQIKLQTDLLKYTQQQMNVAAIASGAYFITVVDEKGNTQTKKVIITR